ncbi:MAG: hypothetical protein RIR00_1842 [Pseudomonadota bacterium]|jgi:anti-anti-sigma factor
MTCSRLLALTDDLTIYHALELKPFLLAALAEADELELDLSGVAAMDTAGLQLLILLKAEAQAAGKALRISRHSPAVSEVIDFCNLGAKFGDPLIIPAHAAP